MDPENLDLMKGHLPERYQVAENQGLMITLLLIWNLREHMDPEINSTSPSMRILKGGRMSLMIISGEVENLCLETVQH